MLDIKLGETSRLRETRHGGHQLGETLEKLQPPSAPATTTRTTALNGAEQRGG